MTNDFKHTYECEDCGGTFIIKPDLDEQILYCPQCGDKSSFKSTYYDYENDLEDQDDYDTF